jgi:WD40 repeat protein
VDQKWQAHESEIWCCAFSPAQAGRLPRYTLRDFCSAATPSTSICLTEVMAQAHLLISGADDCALKTWDIRSSPARPSSVNRCSAQSYSALHCGQMSPVPLFTHPLSVPIPLYSASLHGEIPPQEEPVDRRLRSVCDCRCDHRAGICCVQSSPTQDFVVYTGSYDECIRSWDLRKLSVPTGQV